MYGITFNMKVCQETLLKFRELSEKILELQKKVIKTKKQGEGGYV